MTTPLDANEPDGRDAPSWYAASAPPLAPATPLSGEVRAEICVVGGGFTGLSAALHLAEAGRDVRLLEARRPGWGASGRNGGQVGSGQRLDVVTLEAMYGLEVARGLWAMGEDAKALVVSLVERLGIACDLTPGILHANHRARDDGPTREIVTRLREVYGYDAVEPLDRDALAARLKATGYHGGARDGGAWHLHPLAYARGLAAGADRAGVLRHDDSRVVAIEPGAAGAPTTVRTAAGAVTADWVLLGLNGYLGDLDAALGRPVSRHVAPINNFIIATEALGRERAEALIPGREAVADSRFVVNYFRLSADHRLLFGGGETYGVRFPRDIAGIARRRMLSVFPQLEDVGVDHAWGGTLGITPTRLPHFAEIAPRILSAGGYSGHGVALATLAGQAMAAAAQGDRGRFSLLADRPPPPFPGGAALRSPLLTLAMLWYGLRDRL